MKSVWTRSVKLPRFGSLEGEIKTDVLIIGGGLAGILCAHFLKERGINYVLAEGRNICSGVTQNTTAKITSQHGLIYHKLLNSMGQERAKGYLEANQRALERYAKLAQYMDFDFEKKTAYVYSVKDRGKLETEAKALEKLGFSPIFSEGRELLLPFDTAGAVGFEHQAQFHPLKFISELVQEMKIYENTFVQKLSKNRAVTEKGAITFEKVIFATHFPIDNKHGLYFLKMYQGRSYVIALDKGPQVEGMYLDEAKGGMSFRNYGNLLLIGGGGHRTGKKGGNWQELRSFANRFYPWGKERYFWAAQDCMTLDAVPYIGRYSSRLPGWFVATGFNKWGMTSSMVAAEMLADMVMERENPYEEVFRPSRSMRNPQLLVNGWEAAVNLLSISEKRCPHLGCALKWNAMERSWDCPCHGSRFDEHGRVLNNPANGDLS